MKRLAIIATFAVAGLSACGDDDSSVDLTTVVETTEATTTTAEPTTTERATTTTEASTTTAAPTTTTTIAATPEELFLAAAREQIPDRVGSLGEEAVVSGGIGSGRAACADAANGVAVWGDKGPLDGAQALAFIWEVAMDHDSARLARLAIRYLCPEQQPVLDAALGMPPLPQEYFAGVYRVGVDIEPGTYLADGGIEGCYWERQDANGEIIDNNYIDNAIQAMVTIESSDFAFMTDGGCGGWLKVG